MERTTPFFEIEQQDELLIVTPEADMGELDFERIDAAAKSDLGYLTSSDFLCILDHSVVKIFL